MRRPGQHRLQEGADEARKRLTGSALETYPTFLPRDRGRNGSTNCPTCGGPARRRACPQCHTALPIDFVDSKSPMIGLVGAKGSGKTVLMTVLVKQLREVVGLRFGADIRIATDNPDGHQGLSDYQASREVPAVQRAHPADRNRTAWHSGAVATPGRAPLAAGVGAPAARAGRCSPRCCRSSTPRART